MGPQSLPSPDEIEAYLAARSWQLRIKRTLDASLALLILLLLSPLLALVAVGVRLDSPGPVLYAQRRWGFRNARFVCYKFRTMHACPGADHRDALPGRPGMLAKAAGDARITRFGKLLRRTSIDELPQLWNVVRGDMSLVGPRPLMIHMLEPYPEIRDIRCAVRPGITGLWQVHDRANNTHVAAMLPYDVEYLQAFDLALDASILRRTVRAVIRGDGAI